MEMGTREGGLRAGTRLTVFSIRKTKAGATIWVRAGNGFVNKDHSVNLWLDVLPIDGALHAREQVVDRRDAVVIPDGAANVVTDLANAPVEGHS